MDKVLVRYYALTVPHIMLFAGAVFGVLLVMGIDLKLAVGIFSALYGTLLLIINLVVREHFWEHHLYKLAFIASILLIISGLLIIKLSI
ncbi:hypothetical protein [Pyrococcus abyssi]|uniref:Uncharacterized protein n=1 Tax=Pyrococcus abyssi (strain GE5 / Orsay) TaxID=272844 RepID=G8ZJW3_PYRAB|nr:hypothetical protein [Pyrococcus abyssi]CCE71070.1 TPA: hypothetical protein PAB1292.1n [Pyrococcus abyssi GE5]